MRSLLPRIFASKSKQPTTKDCEASDGSALVEEKAGKQWRFKIPSYKKYRFRLVVETANSKRSRTGLSSSRKTRKPTLATTQRKLAASRKRLRSLQNQKSCKGTRPADGPSRRTTYPSIQAANFEKGNESENGSGVGSVRRAKTSSAFVMKGEAGGTSIEVEFTDEGEDLATGCQKGTRFPVTVFSVEESQSEDIKVVWKASQPSVSYPKSDNESHIISQAVCNEQGGPGFPNKQSIKNIESAEWESVPGSVEEANAAWLEFNQDQMLAKLAGMNMQQAPKSQEFTARKPMRILPYAPQQSKIPISKRTTSCVNSPVLGTERGRKLSCYC